MRSKKLRKRSAEDKHLKCSPSEALNARSENSAVEKFLELCSKSVTEMC